MSGNIKGPKSFRSMIVMITIIVLVQTIFFVSPSGKISCAGEEEKATRADDLGTWSEVVPNFEVQFMIEPEDDLLSPWSGMKIAKMSPGSVSLYWIMIYNMGPENDTYQISLNEPPRDAGWNWFFSETGGLSTRVELVSPSIRDKIGGITFKVLAVQVECPIDSRYGLIPLIVSAVSETDQEHYGTDAPVDSDQISLLTHDVGNYGFHRWEERIFHVEPGEWVTLPLMITNLGNKDVINVTVLIDENEFWRSSYRDFENIYHRKWTILDYEWKEAHLSIRQGQTICKDIKVRVPPDFFGGDDVFQIRLFGRIDHTNYWTVSEVVTIIVDRYTDITAAIVEENATDITPGESADLELQINNNYYETDYIEDIYLQEPKGVSLKVCNDTGEDIIGMKISPMSSRNYKMNFNIENDAPPGPLDLKVVVRPRYYDPIVLNVTLNVLERIDLKILPTDPVISEVVGIGPGDQRSLVFGILNEGTKPKTVSMGLARSFFDDISNGVRPLDGGWTSSTEWISQIREPANFQELSASHIPADTNLFLPEIGYSIPETLKNETIPFLIQPKETSWVSLKINSPGGEGDRIIPPYPIKAVLLSGSNEILDDFKMVIDVRYSDLLFEEFMTLTDEKGDPITSAMAGQKVFFKANVTNIGDHYSDRARVSIIADNVEIGERWIKPLIPGETVSLSGNFTAVGGMRYLELELDPENDVIESDDQFMEGSLEYANLKRAPLTIEKGKEGSDGVIAAVILSTLSICILMILIGSFLIHKLKNMNINDER